MTKKASIKKRLQELATADKELSSHLRDLRPKISEAERELRYAINTRSFWQDDPNISTADLVQAYYIDHPSCPQITPFANTFSALKADSNETGQQLRKVRDEIRNLAFPVADQLFQQLELAYHDILNQVTESLKDLYEGDLDSAREAAEATPKVERYYTPIARLRSVRHNTELAELARVVADILGSKKVTLPDS